MKTNLALFILLLSSVSLASVQFKTESDVPAEVQKEIKNVIENQCLQIGVQNWLVEEAKTETSVARIDNGLTDTNYFTEFNVYAVESDSNHSRVNRLTTLALLTTANNGVSVSVQVVEGCQ